jgi:hypothetical protein
MKHPIMLTLGGEVQVWDRCHYCGFSAPVRCFCISELAGRPLVRCVDAWLCGVRASMPPQYLGDFGMTDDDLPY